METTRNARSLSKPSKYNSVIGGLLGKAFFMQKKTIICGPSFSIMQLYHKQHNFFMDLGSIYALIVTKIVVKIFTDFKAVRWA